MARNADKVIVVSQASKDFTVERDFIDDNKIEVIHLGFNFSKLSPTEAEREKIRQEFGLKNKFVIGCIASFHPLKGHEYLLKALPQIIGEIPNVKLLFLGTGDKTKIESLINELNLNDYVVFGGYRNDVPACIKAMDLVVHPSLSEAFSQVIVEVMGVGTPIVSTNVGGAAEVITNNETGLLISHSSTEEIVESIVKVHHNANIAKRMADAGQRHVTNTFTVNNMIVKQVNCYRQLIHEK
jgi:glycosyltransferase involved in cell wall biosynthesis